MSDVEHKGVARLLILMLLAAVGGRAAQAGAPPRDFLQLLAASDSTPEARRKAWEQLKAAGAPGKPVLDAIDAARARAWKRFAAFVASPAVAKPGADLAQAVKTNRAAVQDVVAGKSFSKAALDQAMAPITDALNKATAAVRAENGFAQTLGLIDEMEVYATEAGVRMSWSAALSDRLCTLAVVSHYLASPSGKQTLEDNKHAGDCIDSGELACISMLSAYRMLIGLEPLGIDLRLVIAARKHSEQMVEKDYFSHESPTAELKSFGNRARREYTSASGECIAIADGGPAAFNTWYCSQPHHQIMISKEPCVGVGGCGSRWTLMTGGSKGLFGPAAKMTQYVRDRYRAVKDPDRILRLARWCVKNHLVTQAEDELQRVLQIDPGNAEAAKALAALQAKKP